MTQENGRQNVVIVDRSWIPDGKGGWQPTPDLLTEVEAIRYLRLDCINCRFPQAALRRYRKQGTLKVVQIGKQILYPREELERFVKLQMVKNPR